MLKRLTLPCHSFELPYSSDQKRVTGTPQLTDYISLQSIEKCPIGYSDF
jgi:hypothetical protein